MKTNAVQSRSGSTQPSIKGIFMSRNTRKPNRKNKKRDESRSRKRDSGQFHERPFVSGDATSPFVSVRYQGLDFTVARMRDDDGSPFAATFYTDHEGQKVPLLVGATKGFVRDLRHCEATLIKGSAISATDAYDHESFLIALGAQQHIQQTGWLEDTAVMFGVPMDEESEHKAHLVGWRFSAEGVIPRILLLQSAFDCCESDAPNSAEGESAHV
jgi:hypothetical protein